MKKLLAVFVLISCLTTYSQAVSFDFKGGLSSVTGNTSYDIKFNEYNSYYGRIYGESKLEFDIDATLLNFGFEAGFAGEKLLLSATYTTTLSENGGNLRDRDWIYNDYINYYYSPLMGDTDSSVDSSLDMLDINLKWNFLQFGRNEFIKLSAVAGYEKQEWGTFEAKDLHGFYSGLLTQNGSRRWVNYEYSTPILTYEVTYETLYSGLGADFTLNNAWSFSALLKIGVTEAEDTDDHILRNKISRGDADGAYAGFNFQAKWNVTQNLCLNFYLFILEISTEGTQTQYEYNDSGAVTSLIAEVDNEITSEQATFGIKAGYRI